MYHSPPTLQLSVGLSSINEDHEYPSHQAQDAAENCIGKSARAFSTLPSVQADSSLNVQPSMLLKSFGYSEDSNSNTMALLRTVRVL